MKQEQPIFRFAPSPNGELHLGHAYSALLNLKMARAANGKILLRIEDIDTERCTPALEAQMLSDLEWIGFEWDEEPRRQSEHFEAYHQALFDLNKDGLLYASQMSRSEIKKRIAEIEGSGKVWPRDPDGAPHYPGYERNIPLSDPAAFKAALGNKIIRLDVNKAATSLPGHLSWQESGGGPGGETGTVSAQPENWGDFIVARRDTPTSYHLSCTLDDALQGITHIVRGQDLFHATSAHRLLQELLHLPAPSYNHHQLILDGNQKKLSKSDRDTSLRQLRDAGVAKEQILSRIGLI
ncbi:MAG: tRNA glutamyl-Q(34) synthetase GluQRS [Pseudomonadota bacterium]